VVLLTDLLEKSGCPITFTHISKHSATFYTISWWFCFKATFLH